MTALALAKYSQQTSITGPSMKKPHGSTTLKIYGSYQFQATSIFGPSYAIDNLFTSTERMIRIRLIVKAKGKLTAPPRLSFNWSPFEHILLYWYIVESRRLLEVRQRFRLHYPDHWSRFKPRSITGAESNHVGTGCNLHVIRANNVLWPSNDILIYANAEFQLCTTS